MKKMLKDTRKAGGERLPGIDGELVGLKEACRMLGVTNSAKRLEGLGIRPVNEVATGRLVFRAYRKAEVEAEIAKREAAEKERLEALRASNMARIRANILDGQPMHPLSHSPASLDQVFAVLCEVRNHLKTLAAQQQPAS
ncbi:MAG: hypothetical protein WC977_07335 [Anaerovoracaceae bacterium]|jgi:hypothetical protein